MNLLKTEIDIVKNKNDSLKSKLHEKFDDLKTVTENVVDVIAKIFMVKMQLQQDTFEEKTNMILNSLEGQIASYQNQNILQVPLKHPQTTKLILLQDDVTYAKSLFQLRKLFLSIEKFYMENSSKLHRRFEPLAFPYLTDVPKMILSVACLLQPNLLLYLLRDFNVPGYSLNDAATLRE